MKKEESMKTKLYARFALLSVITGSLGATTIAQAQTNNYGESIYEDAPINSNMNAPVDAYAVWCDQVTQRLMEAQNIGWKLFNRQMYTGARTQILGALQDALNSMNIPGGAFRPATYREIVRTISLIQALDATHANFPGENPVLKAKMIAYTALQRISFIAYVKDTVDVTYNIPCRRGCGGYGYPNNSFETAIASVAAEQLSRAQRYASTVHNGIAYPINDTPYYFVIVSKAAQWAAQDLSNSLFNKRFSCAIQNLNALGCKAGSYQGMLGDVAAVQEIHAIVNDLIGEMSETGYGCGYRF